MAVWSGTEVCSTRCCLDIEARAQAERERAVDFGSTSRWAPAVIAGQSRTFDRQKAPRVAPGSSDITCRDWETYPILRFSNVPAIETILIDRPGQPFLGAGEAVAGPLVGAIANAIYQAIGLRLRQMPFDADAVKLAVMQ